MTSDARPREEEVVSSSEPVPDAADPSVPAADGRAEATTDATTEATSDATGEDVTPGRRPVLPLVPALVVLLVLLLGGVGYLWTTRPEASAVRTDEYPEVLAAARSGVVDFTSFDHLTLDDDIEQIRRVATGDLLEEGVAELDGNRQAITDAEAAVSTEILDGGVTRVTDSTATALLVIESQQRSNASEQVQVVRYRIEVNLEKSDGRWLLSGIKGTETGDE